MKSKVFQGTTFLIDRPKGTIKTWKDSGKTFVYPCDYGFFRGIKGEDGEGLDAFVGDEPNGHFEVFQKLRPDDAGNMVLDETKFLVGVNDAQRDVIYKLYGNEVWARRRFDSFEQLREVADRFKPQKKERYQEKTAIDASAFTLTPEQQKDLLAEYFRGRAPLNAADHALADKLITQQQVPIRTDPTALLHGGGGFNWGKDTPTEVIVHPELAKDPYLLAHEFGHAKNNKAWYGPLLHNNLRHYGYFMQMPLAQGLGAGLGSIKSKWGLVAPLISSAVLSAPTLIDEHVAWQHGRKMLEELGASPEQLNAYAKLKTKNLPTYYIMPAVSALSGSLLGGLYALMAKHAANESTRNHEPASYTLPNMSWDPGLHTNPTAEQQDIQGKLQEAWKAHDRKPADTHVEPYGFEGEVSG